MDVQTRQKALHRSSDFFWRSEQKVAFLLAVVLGVGAGVLVGLFRAVKALGPHFKSVNGVKRLYYGDPSSAATFQRSYLNGAYAAASPKHKGAETILPSSEAQTAKPGLVNGGLEAAGVPVAAQAASDTKDYPTDKDLLDSHTYSDKASPKENTISFEQAQRTLFKEDSAIDVGVTPKSGPGVVSSHHVSHTPPKSLATPEDTEADETETEDEGGSEYTASSAPTTPRSSVLAPSGDFADGKKKKKKKLGRKIKKTFSKMVDALTPGSPSPKSAVA